MGIGDQASNTGLQRITLPDAESATPESDLERAVVGLLAVRQAPKLVFQPIVDLQRQVVVGYEVLSRFQGPPSATPDRWFAAATRIGKSAELEALVIEHALSAREQLPPNCFLSINVAPEALLSAPVRTLLRRRPLARLVFELTEHSVVSDYGVLARAIAEVRELGAFVAVDDAGAGYASLQHILALRPDFVKLDRALIAGLQLDEAKAALVEMFGGFTSRIDSWLLAEGIEERDELMRLVQLGVPLGQGYLLGRPQPDMRGIDPKLTASLPSLFSQAEATHTLVMFAELSLTAPADDGDDDLLARLDNQPGRIGVLLLDRETRPVGFATRGGPFGIERRPAMCVLESTDAEQALRRALTRPAASRFDPLACCDERGHYRGLVPVERLVESLLRR
jgi:EAL domain-containing protein (putative c-di-GMP-specific phosphodiesterase class I)